MAQFCGEIQGNRSGASRMGSKDSGFSAHIRGWHIGVRIRCFHDQDTGKDEIYVYKTSGSSGHFPEKLITTLVEE